MDSEAAARSFNQRTGRLTNCVAVGGLFTLATMMKGARRWDEDHR